jgi:hypothetical protein
MKTYGRVRGLAPLFLTSELDGDERAIIEIFGKMHNENPHDLYSASDSFYYD